MAPTIELPAPGDVVLRDGKPYVLCPVCLGGPVTDPMCSECFGAGIAPVFEAARFSFARAQAHGHYAPSLDAPARSNTGGKMNPSFRTGPTLATEKQVAFLETLIRERMPHADSLDEAGRSFCRQGLSTLRAIKAGTKIDRKAMSEIIDEVKQVRVPRTTPAPDEAAAPAETGLDLSGLPTVPEYDFMLFGVPGSDTRLKVRVERPLEGEWAGWIFVKDGAEYGQGARYGMQKPGGTYRGKIEAELAAILADPQAALAKYGEITGRCGVCSRKLEKDESVARGIGPVCASKLGY